MRSKIFVLLLLVSISLIITNASAQNDEVNESQSADHQTSDVSEVPLIGWYVVPVLGAMRRHRHELNDRSYNIKISHTLN